LNEKYDITRYPKITNDVEYKLFLNLWGKASSDKIKKHVEEVGVEQLSKSFHSDGMCRDSKCMMKIKENLLKPGDTILDIGSGAGFYCFKLAFQGFKPTGLEPSIDLVNYVKELQPFLAKFYQPWGEIKFHVGVEKEALEIFGEKSFDVVNAKHVFEHISNPIKALQRWKKLARKGICGILPCDETNEIFEGNKQHLWQFNEDDIKFLLKDQGFVNIGTCCFSGIVKIEGSPDLTLKSLGYWANIS